MVAHLAVATLAIVGMTLVWATVDVAWRRTFPAESARREAHGGCASCADKDSCSLPQKT